MAFPDTIQIGAPVLYTRVGSIKDAAGDLVNALEVCAAQVVGGISGAGTGVICDIKITGCESGSDVGKVVKGVSYHATTGTSGTWTPLTSASNFA